MPQISPPPSPPSKPETQFTPSFQTLLQPLPPRPQRLLTRGLRDTQQPPASPRPSIGQGPLQPHRPRPCWVPHATRMAALPADLLRPWLPATRPCAGGQQRTSPGPGPGTVILHPEACRARRGFADRTAASQTLLYSKGRGGGQRTAKAAVGFGGGPVGTGVRGNAGRGAGCRCLPAFPRANLWPGLPTPSLFPSRF